MINEKSKVLEKEINDSKYVFYSFGKKKGCHELFRNIFNYISNSRIVNYFIIQIFFVICT